MNLYIAFAADYLFLKIRNIYKALLREIAFDNSGNSIQKKSNMKIVLPLCGKELEIRIRKEQIIDWSHQDQIKKEIKTWIKVFERILDAFMFLAKQNLSLRGHRESVDNINNSADNFLELIKFIEKYNFVMKEHLVYIRLASER